jgi:hypothetical protein
MAFLAGPDADPRETSRRLRKAWRKQVAVLAVSPPTDEDALAFSVALDFLDVPLPGLLFVPAPALSHDAAALRVAVPGLPLANPPGLIDISQPSARPVVHAGARAVLAALTAEGLLP